MAALQYYQNYDLVPAKLDGHVSEEQPKQLRETSFNSSHGDSQNHFLI
jgi:hypothetical protein